MTRRQRRLLLIIVLGGIAVVMSFLQLAWELPAGRVSWFAVGVFVLSGSNVLLGVRGWSRPAPTVDASNWHRARLGAVLFLIFGALLDLFLIAFGVGEALGPHHYAWLLLVPFGLWGLTKLLPGIGKVWRADPTQLDQGG